METETENYTLGNSKVSFQGNEKDSFVLGETATKCVHKASVHWVTLERQSILVL